jgi:hypothetical protein
MPHFGQHGVDLGLAVAADPDELGPMPDQLPQFPGRWRGDPRLGKSPHPQQVGKVGGISFVVPSPVGTQMP